MLTYAGIGSRQTPPQSLRDMTRIARTLDEQHYTLQSGGAKGADQAFQAGSSTYQIFRPEHATPNAIELASTVHPAWHNCNEYARQCHGRNAMIVLGQDLDTPVKFLICWTPGGKIQGGTALGIRLAMKHRIPIYNLGGMTKSIDELIAHLIK